MIFDFSTIFYGALSHDPEKFRQKKWAVKRLKKMGIPERRFHARLLELKRLAGMFKNTNSPRDKGMKRLAEAVKRHPKLTKDDIYRILQMELVFSYCTSHMWEPSNGDNWAWKTPMDEYAIDIFVLAVSRRAFMVTPDCARFECNIDDFFKQNRKQLTQAVKFRRKLLAD